MYIKKINPIIKEFYYKILFYILNLILYFKPEYIQKYQNIPSNILISIIKNNKKTIEFISNKKLIALIIKNDPKNLNYIKQNNEIHKFAIQVNPYSIMYMKNPSKSIIKSALNKNGFIIKYIDNPSIDLQNIAIKKSPRSIRYINNPTRKLKIQAISNDSLAISCIHNPDEYLQLLSINKLPKDLETVFIIDCISKITSPIALNQLYQNVKLKKNKERIKKSKHWKDDANLILEVINEI